MTNIEKMNKKYIIEYYNPIYKNIVSSGNLFFTVGTTRSGKSTYCNDWVRFFNNEHKSSFCRPRAVVCSDSIRLALHKGRYNSFAEPMVFAIKHYTIKSLLDRGHDVIVDGTHTTDVSIRRLLEIEPTATPIIFTTDPNVCKRRAIESGQYDVVAVIDRHARQLNELLEEGIDNVIGRLIRDIKVRRGEKVV